jgi:hypothetical protein
MTEADQVLGSYVTSLVVIQNYLVGLNTRYVPVNQHYG